MDKQDLRERLNNLDGDVLALYGGKYKPEITIVGGSALMLLGELPDTRFTNDIDVLEFSDKLRGFMSQYDMNTDVSTFLYNFPEGWQERRKKIDVETVCLAVFTMSLEDLVIAKLMASRKSDWADLNELCKSSNLDWSRLDAIVSNPLEVQINMSKEQWESFLEEYDRFLALMNER